MIAKVLVILIVAGVTACALLVNRQHRIDTAHEISVTHQRLMEQEQKMWRLRSEIAEHTRPEQVRRAIDQFEHSWVAIPAPKLPGTDRPVRLAADDLEHRSGNRAGG